MKTFTCHLAGNRSGSRTLCGSRWESWQTQENRWKDSWTGLPPGAPRAPVLCCRACIDCAAVTR